MPFSFGFCAGQFARGEVARWECSKHFWQWDAAGGPVLAMWVCGAAFACLVVGGEAILDNLPDGVTFQTGSYTINQTFRNTLDRVAQSLTQYPNSLIDVYGYTDSTGSDAFNQRLSEQRAQAVASYLTSRGVAASRIRSQGFGEDPRYFVGDNATAEGRALNRRVEIKIIPFDEQDVREAQAAQR